MSPVAAARIRRATLLVAILGMSVAVVEARAATAPPVRLVTLAAGAGRAGPAGLAAAPGTLTAIPSREASPSRRSSGPVVTPSRSATAAAPRSVLGSAVDIGYGIVQVRLVLSGSRITDVVAVQLPSDGRSADIAAFAVPVLRSEVLARQSAGIDTVSGASYTSDGYARSVQAALDAAGIR